MNKINNNLIGFGLILLVIFALGTITKPTKAFAEGNVTTFTNGGTSSFDNNNYNENNDINRSLSFRISSVTPDSAYAGNSNKNITIVGSGFVYNSIAEWDGSSRSTNYIDSGHLTVLLYASDLAHAGHYSITVRNPNGIQSNSVMFTVDGSYQNYASGSANNKSNNATSTTTKKTDTKSGSSLAAGALFGENGFLPTSLVQWLVFILLFLLVVIIFRKVFGHSKKYHEEPLKHA